MVTTEQENRIDTLARDVPDLKALLGNRLLFVRVDYRYLDRRVEAVTSRHLGFRGFLGRNELEALLNFYEGVMRIEEMLGCKRYHDTLSPL